MRCNKLACADDTLDGRSVPGSFIGASGAIALQQGFPGSDNQHAKKLFQLSVASCEKPPGYAAKLDVVDTYDLLEYRASVLTERPWPAACATSRDCLYLALSVAVKLIGAGAQPSRSTSNTRDMLFG